MAAKTGTYTLISSNTLGSAAASVTFSSIPATYTDLKLVIVCQGSLGSDNNITFNSDTATNYSITRLWSYDAVTPASNRATNQSYISDANEGMATSPNWSFYTYDIFSYAGSTYKTCLINANEDKNGSGAVAVCVGLWRSTSAISTITITNSAGNYQIGTTATIYGILKA